jgi:hypothetical protein
VGSAVVVATVLTVVVYEVAISVSVSVRLAVDVVVKLIVEVCNGLEPTSPKTFETYQSWKSCRLSDCGGWNTNTGASRAKPGSANTSCKVGWKCCPPETSTTKKFRAQLLSITSFLGCDLNIWQDQGGRDDDRRYCGASCKRCRSC